MSTVTGWRRLLGCLKLQVISRKRATNYRALFRKMTYEDKASYDSTPPCTSHLGKSTFIFIGHFPHKSPIISGSFAKMTCNLRHPMTLHQPVQVTLAKARSTAICRKRATNYRAFLQKMTYEDKASYDSTPCTSHLGHSTFDFHTICHVTYTYIHESRHTYGSCHIYESCLSSKRVMSQSPQQRQFQISYDLPCHVYIRVTSHIEACLKYMSNGIATLAKTLSYYLPSHIYTYIHTYTSHVTYRVMSQIH